MRLSFLLLMVGINGAKMGYMIRGMASLGSAVFVAVDLVVGTGVGAILDTMLFGSAPNWQWCAGIAIMTLGVYIVATEQQAAEKLATAPRAETAARSDASTRRSLLKQKAIASPNLVEGRERATGMPATGSHTRPRSSSTARQRRLRSRPSDS